MTTAPSVSAVQILLTGNVGTPADAVVESFIADAMALVSACPCIASKLPEATQTIIVKYLAAHIYTISTTGGAGAKTMDKLGDAQTSWASAMLGEGLKGSMFGQQALAFDTTGCLVELGRPLANFEVLTT